MTLGSLRDQVIYPDTKADFLAKGFRDDHLLQLLDHVQLRHICEREEDGWDTIADWMDVLSGGEKQRVAVKTFFLFDSQLVTKSHLFSDGSSFLSSTSVCHFRRMHKCCQR